MGVYRHDFVTSLLINGLTMIGVCTVQICRNYSINLNGSSLFIASFSHCLQSSLNVFDVSRHQTRKYYFNAKNSYSIDAKFTQSES